MSTEFQKFNEQIQRCKVRVYEQLNEDNSREAKEEFLADKEGKLTFPVFRHDPEKLAELRQNREVLSEIRAEINQSNCSATEKQLLGCMSMWALKSNQQAEKVLSALETERRAQGDSFSGFSFETRRELQAASRTFYGYQVDEELTVALLHESLEKMTDNIDNWTDEEQQYLDEIEALLSSHSLKDAWKLDPHLKAMLYHPDERVVFRFGDLAELKLTPILEHLPYKNWIYMPEEVKVFTSQILNEVYAGQTKFTAEITETGHNFSVNQKKRLIKIPRSRARGPIDYATLYATFGGHEIGTHAGRGIPYENTELSEFSTGFTCYEPAEEGIAKCIERALKSVMNNRDQDEAVEDNVGTDYYVNIGLADQFDFNFRDLWTLRRNILYLTNVTRDGDASVKAQIEQATNKAYEQVRRVFRGTGCAIDYKDLFYYIEEERVWKFITEHINQPDKLWFTLMGLGKVNIFDQQTKAIISCILRSDDFPLAKAKMRREKMLPGILDKI